MPAVAFSRLGRGIILRGVPGQAMDVPALGQMQRVGGKPAGAVSRLGYYVLLAWVPGHALDMVAMLCEALLRLALLHIPHHAHILCGACEQCCRIWGPRCIDDIVRVAAPAHPFRCKGFPQASWRDPETLWVHGLQRPTYAC